ncbi:MAG TPA: hypothetical protein DCP63_11225 [Bacteroidetes bacterium]|nr:hypothetical protein [Bacteroidota bacterium]
MRAFDNHLKVPEGRDIYNTIPKTRIKLRQERDEISKAIELQTPLPKDTRKKTTEETLLAGT